ncbi:MAG: hypothetical protein JJ848_009370 [Prochlorococcus marinus CUG1439]|uniref:hypothetical protein n=1 Tax=Prochlorococcus sp. MIT 1314 TaxID=3096220 RepID=UPI001B1A31F0|nr:hypothetical protein [Prochlorococcus sp. MIT 1314]MCR8540546.1 hypothetical protein [Prochlorococcus marinus CUG1439]
MFKEKSKQFKASTNKSKLDKVLWLIENYLPQKKVRVGKKKLYIDNLEAEFIQQFSKLVSLCSNKLIQGQKNTTISFTFGDWALPYLKFLKKLGITK